MPRPTRTESGDWSFPGPAHPDVIRPCRLWRLPRVYALDGAGEEEARLPPPMAGHDNLPQEFGDRHAFGAIGDASFGAVERGCAALNALRAGLPSSSTRLGPPAPATAQTASSARRSATHRSASAGGRPRRDEPH